MIAQIVIFHNSEEHPANLPFVFSCPAVSGQNGTFRGKFNPQGFRKVNPFTPSVFLWDIGNQHRPRSEAAEERGV